MNHIKAVKTIVCTNCLRYASELGKCAKCANCKKNTLHRFDSAMELNRFLYLKDSPNISKLKCQHEFELQCPVLDLEFFITAPDHIEYHRHTGEIRTPFRYKIDFAYLDSENPKHLVLDEFKHSRRDSKGIYKPHIDDNAKVKLKWLANMISNQVDVVVSYEDKNSITGYSTMKVKP